MKTKRMKFLGILLMAVCLVGCTKPNDDNSGNNNGGGNSGGGVNTDYAALVYNSGWDCVAPTNVDLFVEFIFDLDEWGEYKKGAIVFLYGKDGEYGAVMEAYGTYTVNDNVIKAEYTNINLVEQEAHWTYGHTYGLVAGQNKTVTYTIQSCTENTMKVKESVMGDVFTLTKL